jgi:hypothetical protein
MNWRKKICELKPFHFFLIGAVILVSLMVGAVVASAQAYNRQMLRETQIYHSCMNESDWALDKQDRCRDMATTRARLERGQGLPERRER